EGGDEVVGMVVALVHAQRKRDVGALDGLFEEPGTQALFQEAVGLALVDEEFGETGAVLDESAGIVLAPGGAIGPEVFLESIHRPVGGGGLDDRREGGAALEAVGVP